MENYAATQGVNIVIIEALSAECAQIQIFIVCKSIGLHHKEELPV